MEIGKLLGPELFVKYQQLHNFGQKTGIDLPGEASCEGLLYTADQLGEIELGDKRIWSVLQRYHDSDGSIILR